MSKNPRPEGRRGRWSTRGGMAIGLIAVSVLIVEVTQAGGDGVEPASIESAGFVPVRPVRVLDTRSAIGLGGRFRSTEPRILQVTGQVPTSSGTRVAVPVGARAVVLNVTVVTPTHAGFLSVRPGDDRSAIQTSSLNFWQGAIVPNAVVVALAPDGSLQITYDAYGVRGHMADVLVDVTGYFVGGAVSSDPAPTTTTPTSPSDPTTGTSTPPQTPTPRGDEVLSVSVKTSFEPEKLEGSPGVSVITHSRGVFYLDFLRPMDGCVFSVTHRNFATSFVEPGIVSVELPSLKTRVIIRVFDKFGVVTNGTEDDGFDLLAWCPR